MQLTWHPNYVLFVMSLDTYPWMMLSKGVNDYFFISASTLVSLDFPPAYSHAQMVGSILLPHEFAALEASPHRPMHVLQVT